MKTILLLIHDDAGQEARVQAALDLARASGGHVTCLDVVLPPVVVNDSMVGAGTAALMLDEREQEAANRTALTARLEREDVPWSWADSVGGLADRIVHHAGLADVVVLNRRLDSIGYPDMLDVTSHVVTQARVPVVAVGEASRGFAVRGRALIAWDGRSAATAALKAAVPLLRLAEEVEIFTALNGGRSANTTAAAEYLSRHGVHATVRAVERDGNAPDDLIRAEAERWNAAYIVMGAYTHGRLAETFGGVTKRMLAQSPLPLLLAH